MLLDTLWNHTSSILVRFHLNSIEYRKSLMKPRNRETGRQETGDTRQETGDRETGSQLGSLQGYNMYPRSLGTLDLFLSLTNNYLPTLE